MHCDYIISYFLFLMFQLSIMLVSFEEKSQRNTQESIPKCKNKDQRDKQIG